jgi:hypothetical protein
MPLRRPYGGEALLVGEGCGVEEHSIAVLLAGGRIGAEEKQAKLGRHWRLSLVSVFQFRLWTNIFAWQEMRPAQP